MKYTTMMNTSNPKLGIIAIFGKQLNTMRALLTVFFAFVSTFAISQQSESYITSEINSKIRNITTVGGITKANHANIENTINISKVSKSDYQSVDAVGVNNYTATPLIAKDAIVSGDRFWVKFATTNTATTCALTIPPLTSKPIKTYSNGAVSDPAVNYIGAGQVFQAYYDGTNWQLLGGGGGGGSYTGSSPTKVSVGGLSAGSDISNKSHTEILQSILAPYIAPQFTNFTITGQPTTVEVGTTLTGAKPFAWSVAINDGTVPTVTVYDNTAGTNLLANTPNDGTESITITTIQLNTDGASQSWKAIGNNTSPNGTFNSGNFNVTARFYAWYGAVTTVPTTSATVRALPSNFFYTGATTFELQTGSSQNNFMVALPPTKAITQVIDLDALSANITSQYVLQTSINVADAGATNRAYVIYKMTIAGPYSANHRHSININ